jgi:hypothetical protein
MKLAAMLGHALLIAERRNTYKILVGNPERKTPFERLRSRLEDNTEM